MQVTLEQAGGKYTVHAESGRVYTVDVVTDSCTCADYREYDPEHGCKHRRRVEIEICSKRVPTPDGRIPQRVAADGSRTKRSDTEPSNTVTQICGSILEFNA